MLVLGVQQSDSVIPTQVCTRARTHTHTHTHTHMGFLYSMQIFYHLSHQEAIHTHTHMFFFRIFSIIGYYKILTTVPRVIQKVLAVYLLYI